MKQRAFILISLLVFFAVSILQAADLYNQGTWTKVSDTEDQVLWKLVISTGTDSTGSKHSKALPVANFNNNNARMRAIAASTSDVNILVHNMVDNNPATDLSVTTYEGLDAVSTTAKVDTIGYLDGAEVMDFRLANYISVEVDGQTGTAANVNITIYLALRKDASGYVPRNPVYTVGTF